MNQMMNGAPGCSFDHDLLAELVQVTRDNGDKIEGLGREVKRNNDTDGETIRWVIRCLVTVLCVIALGNKGLDVIQSIWGKSKVQEARP